MLCHVLDVVILHNQVLHCFVGGRGKMQAVLVEAQGEKRGPDREPRADSSAKKVKRSAQPRRGFTRVLNQEGQCLGALLKDMIGVTVMLTQKTRREKRGVPSTPLEITKVSRQKDRLHVKLRGLDARGQYITYTDSIRAGENIEDRYEQSQNSSVVSVVPADFLKFFKGKKCDEQLVLN